MFCQHCGKPMTADAQRAKFIACCQAAPSPLSVTGVNTLMAAIDNIESLGDVSDLVAMTRAN